MPKLAIYIPKDEMRVIEKWRKKINFSQVFMRALHEEIRDRSRRVSTDKEKVQAAAVHYKKMLAASDEPLVDAGFRLGSDHTIGCRLDPETVHRVLQIAEKDELTGVDMETIRKALGADTKQIDKLGQQHPIDERLQPRWRFRVYYGYAKGVAAAWKKIGENM